MCIHPETFYITLHLPGAFIQSNLQVRQDTIDQLRLRILLKDPTVEAWRCWDLNSQPSDLLLVAQYLNH